MIKFFSRNMLISEMHIVIEINKNMVMMMIVFIDDQSNTITFEESIQKKA